MYNQHTQTPYSSGYSSRVFYSRTTMSSGLEHVASSPIPHYMGSNPAQMPVETKVYHRASSFLDQAFTYTQNLHEYFTAKYNEYHAVDNFLKLYRPQTQFIDEAAAVEDIVKETFAKTTGEELPKDIVIRILTKQDMQRVHETNRGVWSDTILGFALHTPIKQIFIREGDLDRVMAVIGHEIGHVLTAQLGTMHDEEAKAFAFEIAWVETIMKHNIGNLKNNFTLDLKPAHNGLHDVAFNFVKRLLRKGKDAIDVYWEIVRRIVTITG